MTDQRKEETTYPEACIAGVCDHDWERICLESAVSLFDRERERRTAEAEQYVKGHDAIAAIAQRLAKQKAELLRALEGITPYTLQQYVNEIRAAIANMKEKV